MIVENCSAPESWTKALRSLPDFAGKAYNSHQYLEALAANNEGTPTALSYRNNTGEKAFYPFLRKKIPASLCQQNLYDIESPYGYGGPFFTSSDPQFITDFMIAHHKWCMANSIIAEFIRFNPLVNNPLSSTERLRIEKNRTTVSINTNVDLNQILHNASLNRQRNFRKAEKAGLWLDKSTIEELVPLYAETMKEVGAEDYYLFSNDYFTRLVEIPESARTIWAAKTRDGVTAAIAIFLEDEMSMHFHLGASRKDLLHLKPNEFLFFKVAEEAFKSKKKLLHLGGGLSDNLDDPLFRFKKGFSQQTHDFHIGKAIHQPLVYQSISSKWQQMTGQTPGILLHYHYGAKA